MLSLIFSTLALAAPATINSVSAAAGNYRAGQAIAIAVNFSAAVTVTGTPTLTLNLSGAPNASCVAITNSTTMTCSYTVVASNNIATLDYASTTALALPGGATITTVSDSSAATLTLATPGAAGSLAISLVAVDTTVPTLPVANIAVNNMSSPQSVTLTFSEAMVNNSALTTLSTYTLKNSSGSITYNIASAIRNSATSVTLSLIPIDQTNTASYITNAEIAARLKVTITAGLTDLAGNAFAATTITEAGSTHSTDVTAPTLSPTFTYISATQVTLSFSKRLNKTRAETLSNYTFSGTGGASTFNNAAPTAAVLASNGTTVTLTIASVNARTGDTINVTAGAGITDLAGNAMVASAASITVDVTPATFTFATVNNTLRGSNIASGAAQISGINAPAYVSVVSGSDSSLLCAIAPASTGTFGAFGSCSATTMVLFNGDQIKVQLTASSSSATTVTGSISIGGANTSFSVNTGAAVNTPAGLTFTGVTGAATTFSNPDPAIYISSNGILVIPATVGTTTMTIMGSAAANTALLLQNNTVVQFNVGGSVVKLQAIGGDALFLIKSFNVDSVANNQVLELASGRALVTGDGSIVPLMSLAVGSGSTYKQLLVMTSSLIAATIDVQRNSEGTFNILGVTTGKVALRLASGASTVAATDLATLLYSNEVVTVSAAGKITSMRVGSVVGSSAVPGDIFPITLPAGVKLRAKIPNLSLPLERISGAVSLMQGLFDFVGSRATITANTQGAHGQLPLLYNSQPLFLIPYGDVLIDTTRPDGITLANDGHFEVSRSGVYVKLTTTVSNLGLFAQAVSSTYGGTVGITEDGGFEIINGGKTTLVRADLGAANSSSLTLGIVTGNDGLMQLQTLGRQQILYPRFFDASQLLVTFKSIDDKISLIDNLNGTVTALMKAGTFILAPEYEVLSPIGGIPPEHRSDSYWIANGVIYFKYPTGAAQGFRVR